MSQTNESLLVWATHPSRSMIVLAVDPVNQFIPPGNGQAAFWLSSYEKGK